MIKRQATETQLVFLFFLTLLLFFQFAPGAPLIPYADIMRLVVVFVLMLIALRAYFLRPKVPSFSLYQDLAVFFLISFFIWSLITSFASGEYFFDSARRAFLAIGTSVIILLSVFYICPRVSLVWRLAATFIIFSTLVSFLGLTMLFFGGEYVRSGYGTYFQTLSLSGIELTHEIHTAGTFSRISSTTRNPNALGFLSGLTCVIVFSMLVSKKIKLSLFLLVFFVNFSALLYTLSRGAIISFALSVFIVLFFYNKRKVFVYLVGFFVSLIVLMPVYIEPVKSLVESRIEQGLHGRQEIWSNALQTFSNHPLMGVGFGLEQELVHNPSGIKWTMHNGYLVVLVETGILGFLLMVCFLFVLTLSLISGIRLSSDQETRSALILIFSIAVFILTRSMVETAIFRFTNYNVIFMMVSSLGMVLSANRYRNNKVIL